MIRWYAYAAAATLLIAATGLAARKLYKAGYTAAETKYQLQIAQADAKAQEAARQAEQKLADAVAKAAAQYEKGKQDAQASADRVAADLRAGTLRLRKEWAGCETSRLSEAAQNSRELDAAEQRRIESASRIVRAAAECDAQVAGLQSIVHSVTQ